MEFLDGDHQPVLDRLEADMRGAAAAMEFEQAARLRDRLATVRRATEPAKLYAPCRMVLPRRCLALFGRVKGQATGRRGRSFPSHVYPGCLTPTIRLTMI